MENRTDSRNRCLFLCVKLIQTSLALLSPLPATAAERKAERCSRRLSAERHAVAVAPAPEHQRAAETETRLGHPTHQRARKFPRALPTAARAGKWRPLPLAGEGLGSVRLLLRELSSQSVGLLGKGRACRVGASEGWSAFGGIQTFSVTR